MSDDSKNTYIDIEAQRGVMLAVKGGVKTAYILESNPFTPSWVSALFASDTHVADHAYRIAGRAGSADREVVVLMGSDMIHQQIEPIEYDNLDQEVFQSMVKRMQDAIDRALAGRWPEPPPEISLDIEPLPVAVRKPYKTGDWRQRLAPKVRRKR